MQGTLAPPPAYGLEAGSLLLERGVGSGSTSATTSNHARASSRPLLRDYYDYDEDDDDERPLIQIHHHIPIPQNGGIRYPAYSPPAYSTFPRPAAVPPPNHIYTNESSSSSNSDSSWISRTRNNLLD